MFKYITLVLLLGLSTVCLSQGYTGNEVYSWNFYDAKTNTIISNHWYRRYHKGFFVEATVDNTGRGTHGAFGYQIMDKTTIIDMKVSNKDYSVLSIMKRF